MAYSTKEWQAAFLEIATIIPFPFKVSPRVWTDQGASNFQINIRVSWLGTQTGDRKN